MMTRPRNPLLCVCAFLLVVAGCASRRPAEDLPISGAASSPSAATDELLAERARDAAARRDAAEIDPAAVGDELDRSAEALMQAAVEPDALPGESLEPSPLDELPEAAPGLSARDIDVERSRVGDVAPAEFDIPIVINDQVLSWVDYFSGRGREKFAASLERSGRYLPMIHRVFDEVGIPKDLAYMAHVESSFKVTAYSRAKAKGIFQFISGTGRRYGLRIDSWVDERSDPEASARAAAAYLKDLHSMFGDWYLALAAYNTGEGRVQRSLARTGAEDFWELSSDRKALFRETKSYVPMILAATLVAKEPVRYGFDVAYEPPLDYETVSVPGGAPLLAIAKASGDDFERLKGLNPHLRRQRTPPGKSWDLRVPRGRVEAIASAVASLSPRDLHVADTYRVRRGDTWSGIAKKHGVSTSDLVAANGASTRTVLKVGRTLEIPYGGRASTPRREHAAATAHVASSYKMSSTIHAAGTPTVHRVRRGETLTSIARDYRTTARAIAEASGIDVEATLHVGDRLRVGGSGASKSDPAESRETVVHTVRRGENLYAIATRYRVTVDEICALNQIRRDQTLYPGKRLTIRTN